MRRSRYSEHEIALALQLRKQGATIKEVCRKYVISPALFYVWQSKYGSDVEDLSRLMLLETENARLERELEELSLDWKMLQAILFKAEFSVEEKRGYAEYLKNTFFVSTRRACRVLGLTRTVYSYRPRRIR